MAKPSEVFASLPELLFILAENIRSRKLLARLRLVNKTFANAVSPVFFRDVTSNVARCGPLLAVAESQHLQWLQSLTIKHRVRYSVNADSRLNDIVCGMLPQTPNLKSFTWWDAAPLETDVLRVLHRSCPGLRTLRLGFRSYLDGLLAWYIHNPTDELRAVRRRFAQQDIVLFHGLEELCLQNLYQPLSWWSTQIAQTLKQSPRLHTLMLHTHISTTWPHDTGGVRPALLLSDLCTMYGKDTGPLPIRTLILGPGPIEIKVDLLKNLVDLNCLREVQFGPPHVDGPVWTPGSNPSRTVNLASLEAFRPWHAPNIRHFTVKFYNSTFQNWILDAFDDQSIRRLSLAHVNFVDNPPMMHDKGSSHVETSPLLPLHFRMLRISPTRSLLRAPTYGEDGRQIWLELISVDDILRNDIVPGDNGTLEGLDIQLATKVERGGRSLQQEIDRLVGPLKQLSSLSQLSLRTVIRFEDPGDVASLRDTSYQLARDLQRLRYIRVDTACSRIWRKDDGTVHLEELDDVREINDVELFRVSPWDETLQYQDLWL